MKVESFRPADLHVLVRAWNGWFGERRRFRPLTAELLRSKVLRHPDFDPRGLLLAREGRRLAGFIHAGRRKGQGFIAFVWVDPSCRRRDLGTLLWHRALEFARTAGQVLFLNPWENPFYGNPPGEPPLWGTPFGPALDWSDSATLKFLARKGYAPQSRAALLARDLATAVPPGRRPKGKAVWSVMDDGTCFLYEFEGTGGVLTTALVEMRVSGGVLCETLSHPELRPRPHRLLLDAGFEPAGSVAVF